MVTAMATVRETAVATVADSGCMLLQQQQQQQMSSVMQQK